MKADKRKAIEKPTEHIKDSEYDIMSLKEVLLKAESLDVPTGGQIEQGTIVFFVDNLIEGVEAYAKEQVIEELERTVNFLSPNWTYSDIRNEILIKISILKQK